MIELLVVIAIIGILAGIVLVSLNSSRSKAQNAKILTEMVQMKTRLEQSFQNNGYADLAGSAGHTDSLVPGSGGNSDLTLLLCDIGQQTSYPTTVSGDVTVDCASPGVHSGVVIYSNATGAAVSDYGIYATTTPGGYVCADSFGHTLATTSAAIPAYAQIVSTSTALCQ